MTLLACPCAFPFPFPFPVPCRSRRNINRSRATCRRTILSYCLASCLGVAAPAQAQAQASPGADVTISAILRPGACNTTFSNGGVFDFQTLYSDTLKSRGINRLAPLTARMNIDCPAPTALAIETWDNNPSEINNPGGVFFGLRHVDDNDIGSYLIEFDSASLRADAARATLLYKRHRQWQMVPNHQAAGHARAFSWTALETNTPSPFQRIGVDLSIRMLIKPTSMLPITQEIPLEGSATFVLHYL